MVKGLPDHGGDGTQKARGAWHEPDYRPHLSSCPVALFPRFPLSVVAGGVGLLGIEIVTRVGSGSNAVGARAAFAQSRS